MALAMVFWMFWSNGSASVAAITGEFNRCKTVELQQLGNLKSLQIKFWFLQMKTLKMLPCFL
jgi:hypothetical protein